MVDKYVKPSISGYNSSPPPDDDSQTAANAVSWSKHKTKLADPIKTLLDAVNTATDELADGLFGNAVRADSAGGNLATSDYGKLIKTSNAVTITLLTGSDAGSNFVFAFYNADSTNNLTIARNGNNINGAASNLTITPGEGGIAFCDGTDWWVIKSVSAVFIDTNFKISGSSDATKLIRFEVDGLTTAQTRVITPPDVDVTLPYKPGTYGGSQVYTASDTWTKPAGLKRVRVIVTAGGGGGGGCAQGGNATGGGGGAGATSIDTIETADLGATETVTVGAAGAASATGNNTGGTGGTSSFGTHCACAGGAGGSGSGTATAGAGGAVTTPGDIDIAGGPGFHGNGTSSGLNGVGGNGGSSYWGGGGLGAQNTGNGAAALCYGGGGAGAADNNTADRSGGAGKAGIVIVEEFF